MCGPAAKVLADALEHETDAEARSSLANGLASLAARLDAAGAAKVCGPGAKILADALEQATDADARQEFGNGLKSLAARLSPAEVAKLARNLADALEHATAARVRMQFAEVLASLAAQAKSGGGGEGVWSGSEGPGRCPGAGDEGAALKTTWRPGWSRWPRG